MSIVKKLKIKNGRLGTGNVTNCLLPVKVSELRDHKIIQVFAGSVHTCALTNAGEIFSCGKHEYTGHGSISDVLVPKLLDAFQGKNICQVNSIKYV